ncbi:MAG: CPBP family intramembrane metalloprotease [Ktedonobacteraceae bacterium]|nr:CPBP family intramembrane metalloprotease [Ktedonobacteraceae bacterium]
MTALQKLSLNSPILVGLGLLLIALAFRLLDIFVLRLDERLGEIILSKSLGFILVVLFIWGTGHQLKDIGLHSQFIGQSLLAGAGITVIALAVGYGVEFILHIQQKAHPILQFAAIDPKTLVSGGVFFALWLLVGNIVNSFMEEGLFRGIMIHLFGSTLSLSGANWLQAFLFASWHLPWVLKSYQMGELSTASEVAFGVVSNFVPQLVLGIVWGYLYLKTNNLWACWIAHTLTNSAVNFLHVRTAEGLDKGLSIRMITFVVVMVLSILVIKQWTGWLHMPGVRPWGK